MLIKNYLLKEKVKLNFKINLNLLIISNKHGSDLNLVSNIELSELDIKNQNLIKEYLPKTKRYLKS